MPTSLVSTGITFPDATTQTTKATVNSVTVAAGTGLSGGGTVTNSGTITLNNAGVTSITAGTGISVSGSTGGVTISSSAGASGMTLISTTTISAATTTITNCFSGTYSYYKVLITIWDTANASIYPTIQFYANGALDSGFAYSAQVFRNSGTTVSLYNSGQTDRALVFANQNSYGSSSSNPIFCAINIDLSENSSTYGYISKITGTSVQSSISNGIVTSGGAHYVGGSGRNATITGFGVIAQNGTGGAAGTIKVYGMS